MIDIVEDLRQKLRGLDYGPVSDAELAGMRTIDAEARHNDLIEGIEEDGDIARLFAMLREERVPAPVQTVIVNAYLDRRFGPATSGANG